MNPYIAAVLIGVPSGLLALFGTLATVRAARHTSDRENDTEEKRVESEAYQRARDMEARAVEFLGQQVDRLTVTVARLETELDNTKKALHKSELRVDQLERLARAVGIDVPAAPPTN